MASTFLREKYFLSIFVALNVANNFDSTLHATLEQRTKERYDY